MISLGESPILFPGLGGFFPPATSLFSPTELEYMQGFLNQTGEDDQKRFFDGIASTIKRLKLDDSVNAKMALFAINELKGDLSEQAAKYDEDFPAYAPHAVLLGPAFPRDARDIPIAGKISSISGSKVVDDRGLFADPFWSTVAPSERLTGHVFHVLSGARSGDDIPIVDHLLKGSGAPCVVLDDVAGLSSGDKFKILDITLPQDDLRKKQRSRDWIVSTAITDTFDGSNTSPVIRSGYWTLTGNLKGRDLISGGTAYKITAHSLGVSVTLEGAPVLAGAFTIMAKSPFETGIQGAGTLKADDGTNYGLLEPNTKIRLTSSSLGSAADPEKIRNSEAMIDRYLHLRFKKYFGSYVRLNRFRKTSKLINEQFEQQQIKRDDMVNVAAVLNLPLSTDS